MSIFTWATTLLGSDDTVAFQLERRGGNPGPAALKVVAHDDHGGSVTSAVVNVTVRAAVAESVFVVDPERALDGLDERFSDAAER